VDDARAAAHESKNALDELVESIELQLIASIPEDYSDLIISSRIRIEEELCMKTSLRTIEEINTLLNPLVSENSTSNGENDMLYARVASVEAASPKIDNGADSNGGLIIEYNLLNTVTLTETIPYETVYIDDYESFVGTEKVIEEGSNGVKAVTYELIYDASGVYLEKRATSETVITEPTSHVISRGVVEIPKAEPTGTLIWPCDRPKGVSSYYGWRDLYGRPDFHLGIDIPDAKGSDIWAADGGKVLYAGFTPSYGYNVHVEHTNGFSTLYAHLDTICVNEGDMLYPGQRLGTMGNTGVAYGTHLHFEVRINNKTVDPIGYLPEE